MHFTKILKLTILQPHSRIYTVTHNQFLLKFCDLTAMSLNKSFEIFGKRAIFEKRHLTV